MCLGTSMSVYLYLDKWEETMAFECYENIMMTLNVLGILITRFGISLDTLR